MSNVAQAQEGEDSSPGSMGELVEIIRNYDASKCPPERNCTNFMTVLGVAAGIGVALRAIIDGLNTAETHGCNQDFCSTLVRFIDRDLGHINELLSRAKGFFNKEKVNAEEIDFLFNDASQLITDIAQYYPLAIDLLARYGRGRP